MMRAAAVLLMALAVVASVAAGPTMQLYEKSPDKTYKRVLVPVSSTVIPLEELPVLKVGVGVGVGSSITIDEKLRPDGPVKLVTIHSLRKDKNKKKKAEANKDASAALIEELTEEEYRTFTQQEQEKEKQE